MVSNWTEFEFRYVLLLFFPCDTSVSDRDRGCTIYSNLVENHVRGGLWEIVVTGQGIGSPIYHEMVGLKYEDFYFLALLLDTGLPNTYQYHMMKLRKQSYNLIG